MTFRFGSFFKNSRELSTVALLLVSLWAATRVVAAPMLFDIPAQPAPAALQLFIKQSGQEVLFSYDELKSSTSQAVKGEHEPMTALTMLLQETGYAASAQADGRFLVTRTASLSVGSVKGTVVKPEMGSSAGIRIIVRETGQMTVTDRRGDFALARMEAGTYTLIATSEGLQPMHITDVRVRAGRELTLSRESMRKAGEVTELTPFVVRGRADEVTELDKYVVEGRREKPFTASNLDITRTREDVLPFTTFTAREVETSGASNVEDFLRNRLSSFVADNIPEEINGSANAPTVSQNAVNLRGWGSGSNAAQETVILVNGRRLPTRFSGSNSDASMLQGEFRSIPIGSIERIEVLSSAGSAIYGAGATGGVINIITKHNYRGGQLALSYENPWDGNAPRRSADINYGMPLGAGFALRLSAGFSRSVPLNVEDRADVTINRWVKTMMERAPERIISPSPINPLNTTALPTGRATPNIRTTATSAALMPTLNLFGPGTPNYTSVPDGYTGGGGIAPFLSRQGVYNFSLGAGGQDPTYGRQATLGSNGENTNIVIGLDRTFWVNWRSSLEYRYTQSDLVGSSGYFAAAGGNGTLVVPAAAPSNPFGQDVTVAFDDPRMDRPEVKNGTRNRSSGFGFTLRGEIGEWRALADVTIGTEAGMWDYTAFFSPIGGWRNALLTGAYNPFLDMRVAAPAAPEFYEEYVLHYMSSDHQTQNRQGMLKFSGPLYTLPAGDVLLTVGGEWSWQHRKSGRWLHMWLNNITGEPQPTYPGDPSREANVNMLETPANLRNTFESYSGYSEMEIPFLSAKQQVPWVHRLSAFGSFRVDYTLRDSYRATGEPISYRTTPTTEAYGFRYDAIEGVAARVSRSVGIRPPTIAQITEAVPPTQSSNVLDTRRNSQAISLAPNQYITGGNPDLVPMTTTSTNFGLILQPKWIKGLRFSIDYVESVRDDVISSLSVQQAIDLELDLPGRITRAPAEAGAPNGVGVITFVDARQINFRQMLSKSVDFSVEQRFENIFGGRIFFNAAATKQISFKVQSTNTTPAVEQVKNPSAAFSQAIVWNANAQVRWERGAWTLGWSGRFLDDVLVAPANYVTQGSAQVGWAMDHDVFVGYRTPTLTNPRGFEWFTSGLSLTLGMKNVLNREPRFWSASSLGYLSQDSIIGRSVWVQLRKTF